MGFSVFERLSPRIRGDDRVWVLTCGIGVRDTSAALGMTLGDYARNNRPWGILLEYLGYLGKMTVVSMATVF